MKALTGLQKSLRTFPMLEFYPNTSIELGDISKFEELKMYCERSYPNAFELQRATNEY